MNRNSKFTKSFLAVRTTISVFLMMTWLTACGTPIGSSSSAQEEPQSVLHKITFDSRGGTAIASAEIGKDATGSIPENPTWKDEYIFEGWYTDLNYTTPFENSGLSNDATIYAKWTKAGKTVRTQPLDLYEVTQDESNLEEGWAWDHTNRALTLSGLVLDTSMLTQNGASEGIVFPRCPKDTQNAETAHKHMPDCPVTTLILTDDTHNIVDVSNAISEQYSSAVYCSSPLNVKTSGGGNPGTFTVTAGSSNSISTAIFADGNVVIESGQILATAGDSVQDNSVGIGVYGEGSLHVKNGTVTAIAGTTMAAPRGENPSGSFGILSNEIQIDDGSVTGVGGAAKDALSVGILGTWRLACNGGQIKAKGDIAAVSSFMKLTMEEGMAFNMVTDITQIKGIDPNGNLLHTFVDETGAILNDVTLQK